MMHDEKTAILAFIEKHRPQLLDTAMELMRVRTITTAGDINERYAEINEKLKDHLLQLGALVQEHRKNDAAGPNLVAHFPGTAAGYRLAIGGHTDVVVAEDEGWLCGSGFTPKIIDDRLYGRGASDMKGGLAAALLAIEAFRTCVPRYQGEIIFVASVDEEIGGENGMRFLAEQGHVIADGVINPEQTDLEIKTAYKGNLWLTVTVHGRAAHGSTPENGVNAVVVAAECIQALYATGIDSKAHPLLGSGTFNIGTIRGGEALNVVPGTCTFTLDIRLVPGQVAHDVKAHIQKIMDQAIKKYEDTRVDVTLTRESTTPFELPAESSLVEALAAAAKTAAIMPTFGGFISAGDMGHFQRQGVAALMCGPGSLKHIHGRNEFVELQELERAAKLYALTMLSLLPKAKEY